MTSDPSNTQETSILNLRESFFHEDLTSVDEFFNNVDDRVNHKIAQGMKRAIRLIVGQFDKHMLNKIKMIVRDELDDKMRQEREAKRQRSTSTTKSKESYTKFNGVRPPSQRDRKPNSKSADVRDNSLSSNSVMSGQKDIPVLNSQKLNDDVDNAGISLKNEK